LVQLVIPDGLRWEVLVVNNRSTDNTGEVATEFEQLLPIRLISEPQLGLSKARNSGLLNAKGKLIIFLDDDVLVDPACVSAFWNAASAYPEAKLYGGIIEPLICGTDRSRDEFLQDPFFDGLLLRKNLGPCSRLLTADEYFFGACFAGKEDFIRRVPCPNGKLCIDEDNHMNVIAGNQFTFRIRDFNQARFWYISLCSCNRNLNTCTWNDVANHSRSNGKVSRPSYAIAYDIWIVNGNPELKGLNQFEHHYTYELHDIFELYLISFLGLLIVSN
jgi:glycosyltransferase involved in cell wall biosynthesis